MDYIYKDNCDFIRRRIKGLREEKNLSQKEIAQILGISQRTYSYYETNRDIPISVLIKLANFYNVTTDYLLNREDNKI